MTPTLTDAFPIYAGRVMEFSDKAPLQIFNPREDYAVVSRRLPHWSQAGTVCFITWRTWDSMPRQVVSAWLRERNAWLLKHGIDPVDENWRQQLERIDKPELEAFKQLLSDRWNEHLDQCHGSCVLRQQDLSRLIADSLLHFNEDRYLLTDFVVMPNHVHLLVAFRDENSLLAQCESWKRFTARNINQALGRQGRFWQQESFDHLVRSVDQFEYLQDYIASNPQRANLRAGEYIHWRRM